MRPVFSTHHFHLLLSDSPELPARPRPIKVPDGIPKDHKLTTENFERSLSIC